MSSDIHQCTLADTEVRVLAPLKSSVSKFNAIHSIPKLLWCSHRGKGKCPVQEVAEGEKSDSEESRYKNTVNCEYLIGKFKKYNKVPELE